MLSTKKTHGRASIEGLLDRGTFAHEINELQVIETHISWVILAGKYAYKIKKPVKFDFVDYTSIEKRRHFCFEEVELNRRFAPDIYLGVVPIVESDGKWRILNILDPQAAVESSAVTEPTGIVEYAVKMNRFPQCSILAAKLDGSDLTADAVERFGRSLVECHSRLKPSLASRSCVQPASIAEAASGNFPITKNSLSSGPLAAGQRLAAIERLEKWTQLQIVRLMSRFRQRLDEGFVRQCHGDLHLKNIVQLDGQIMAFDGIEFNESFQWIDVFSELAFPVMDFWARGRCDLSWRLLNAYLEQSNNYQDLDVLRFYLVYRAMVRAKVTCLNPKNHDPDVRQSYLSAGDPEPEMAGPWDKYLKAANFFAFELSPRLAITHGLSGSGKSTAAMKLIDQVGGVRIRSDVIRQRLATTLPEADKYTSATSDRVYGQLLSLAGGALDEGFPVVVDATFLKQDRRLPFLKLAAKKEVQFEIIDCSASLEELCKRIQLRGSDPSEATVEVLKRQIETHESLSALERTMIRTHASVTPKTFGLND